MGCGDKYNHLEAVAAAGCANLKERLKPLFSWSRSFRERQLPCKSWPARTFINEGPCRCVILHRTPPLVHANWDAGSPSGALRAGLAGSAKPGYGHGQIITIVQLMRSVVRSGGSGRCRPRSLLVIMIITRRLILRSSALAQACMRSSWCVRCCTPQSPVAMVCSLALQPSSGLLALQLYNTCVVSDTAYPHHRAARGCQTGQSWV